MQVAYPDYFAQPVGSWGDRTAQLLVVGLAPGLHGAYRTGKAFVGDASGALLFEALFKSGLATSPDAADARLVNTCITNAVKCLPPKNAPLASEVNECSMWLRQELASHLPAQARKPRVVLSLGGVAFRAVARELNLPAGNKFTHGATFEITPKVLLVASFHPSRLNMNTGRINLQMMMNVLQRAKDHLIAD